MPRDFADITPDPKTVKQAERKAEIIKYAYLSVLALVLAGTFYYIGVHFNTYLFATLHPDQVAIRMATYKQAEAVGRKATSDYLALPDSYATTSGIIK